MNEYHAPKHTAQAQMRAGRARVFTRYTNEWAETALTTGNCHSTDI